MGSPTSIAALGMQAASGFIGGMNEASGYDAQSKMATNAATSASAVADAAEEKSRRAGRQALGSQIANIAESGIGFTQTTQDAIDQNAANISLDALNQRFQGATERTQDMNQAAIYHAKARTARTQAWLGLGSTLLGGQAASSGSSSELSGDIDSFLSSLAG